MAIQDVYFATLSHACLAMEASFSDRQTGAAFGRLERALSLIRLRRYGTDAITVDPRGNGFPLLSEIVSLTSDLRAGAESEESPAAIRTEMLDYMLARRRPPDDRMLARMAQAVYRKKLAEKVEVFESEPDAVELRKRRNGFESGWDYWDGATGTPVVVRCQFVPTPDRAISDMVEIEQRLCRAARLFSGVGFKPVSLAGEIDDAMPELRLKGLAKTAIGPFRSDLFTDSGDDLDRLLRSLPETEHSWALAWTADKIVSCGTAQRSAGFFRRSRPYEKFVVETAELEKNERGCTDFERHLLLRPETYRLIADRPEARAVLDGRRVHVLDDSGSLTEDV